MSRPVIICLTPVRNEAWLLDWFLSSASAWADHIIVADQRSTDGSREIAARHPKVQLIDNDSDVYDEAARQQLLLDAARQTSGPRILIALDADEALSSNWRTSAEWAQMMEAPPGTVLRFRWANVRPDRRSFWSPPSDIVFGVVDDGRPHSGLVIHSARVPVREDAPQKAFAELVVLHLQYVDWARMASKQRWYQCWEHIHNPHKRAIALYRQYHHMLGVRPEQIKPIPPDWMAEDELVGYALPLPIVTPHYHWDEEVVGWIERWGTDFFRKLDIWQADWTAVAKRLGRIAAVSPTNFRDPRSAFEMRVHRWLERTQYRSTELRTRIVQWILKPFGW